jgi:RNA polymerase sigma factor (sigma-70 family)
LVVGSRAAAEDAVQEALARAWERSDRGESIDNLAGWVTTVSMNLSRSALRRRRAEARARGLLERASSVAAPEDLVDLERAVASLPRRQREAVSCRYYLGLDTAETALAMNVSEGTVKTCLFRARRALAAALALDDETTDEPEEADHARPR